MGIDSAIRAIPYTYAQLANGEFATMSANSAGMDEFTDWSAIPPLRKATRDQNQYPPKIDLSQMLEMLTGTITRNSNGLKFIINQNKEEMHQFSNWKKKTVNSEVKRQGEPLQQEVQHQINSLQVQIHQLQSGRPVTLPAISKPQAS